MRHRQLRRKQGNVSDPNPAVALLLGVPEPAVRSHCFCASFGTVSPAVAVLYWRSGPVRLSVCLAVERYRGDPCLVVIKRIEFVLRRVNGFGAISWKEGIDPRDEVERLVDELSMRRALYQAHAWEVPQETMASVLEIRREVVATMKNVRQGSWEHRLLRLIGKACLDYLDNCEIVRDRRAMEQALDTLRLLFGTSLLVHAERHYLDVGSEHATIILPMSTLPSCVSA